MTVDLTAQVLCRNLYIDYYFKGNKAGTSLSDIKLIEREYSDYISQWRGIGQGVEKDTNEYAIDDSDWNLNEQEGKQQAEEETGYHASGWKNAGNATVTGTNAAISLGGSLATLGAGQGIGNFTSAGAEAGTTLGTKTVSGLGAKVGEKLSGDTAKLSEKAGEKGAEALKQSANKGSENFGNGAWVIAIPIELASAIMALATNQNGKEADALAELTNMMGDAQGNLMAAQSEMEYAAAEVADKEQEILDINDASGAQMVALQTKTNMLFNMYTALKAKKEKGVTLTAGEQSVLLSCQAAIVSNNGEQDSLFKATETARGEAISELGEKSVVFEAAGEIMANTQGMTDYGASFDKCTKALCIITMASDALNVAGAVKNGYKAGIFAASGSWAFGATAWAWAWVAMAAAAAVMSGIDGVRQYKHLQTINAEIEARGITEEVNQNTYGTYDTDVTEFEGSMQSLENMEVLELEQKTVPTVSASPTPSPNPSNKPVAGKIKPPKLL